MRIFTDAASTESKVIGQAGKVEEGAKPLRFSQTTANPYFSDEGFFSNKSISQVADELRTGVITPKDVPINFVENSDSRLIVNTRSSLALRQAGITEDSWYLIDNTLNPETQSRIQNRLIKNELTNEGTDTLRITGSGKKASTLYPGGSK